MGRQFIGDPNKDEYYEEDDVEAEVYYEGADNFIYLDPNEMGIEVDDDDDDYEWDANFESFSSGDHSTSEDEDEFLDDDESLSDETQEFLMGEVNFEPNNRVSYIKGSVESNDTDSEYTQSSDDIDTVLEKSSSGS